MEIQTFLPIIGALILLFGLLFLLVKAKPAGRAAWKTKALQNLNEIENRARMGDILHLKSALVDADKLLDYVMKSRGVRGDTMGERLKHVDKYFDKNQYNKIWDAHRLRNRSVHEIDFVSNESHLKEAYSILKSAIYKLSS